MSYHLRIDFRSVRWHLALPLDQDQIPYPLWGYDQVEMAWWQPSGLPLDRGDIVAILASCEQRELDAVLFYHLQTGHTCNPKTCSTPSLVDTRIATRGGTSAPSEAPPSAPVPEPSPPF